MLAILSPAKTLDFETVRDDLPPATQTRLDDSTAELVAAAARLDADDLMRLMSISRPLAELNVDRFRNFADAPERPAIQAFDGDVYDGLDAKTLDTTGIEAAQARIRILSGLFGLVRPLDAIRPYRLEMGTKRFPGDRRVAVWWEDRIAQLLRKDVVDSGEPSLLNLASEEYYSAVKGRLNGIRVVDVMFMTGDRFVTFHAKVARGVMARWLVDHRIDRIDDARGFDAGGYAFDATTSTRDGWTFRKAA